MYLLKDRILAWILQFRYILKRDTINSNKKKRHTNTENKIINTMQSTNQTKIALILILDKIEF